jgi:Ca2+-binding RTX toxin-like protein
LVSTHTGDDFVNLWYLAADTDQNTVWLGAGDDKVSAGPGSDAIFGDQGEDIVSYEMSLNAVVVNLQAGTGSLGASGDTFQSVEDVWGSNFDDHLIGNGAYNGLSGGAGDDVIRGGAGGDYLVGDAGFDTLEYRGSDSGVRIDLASGQARGGDAQGDQFVSFEAVVGSAFNDQLSGDSGMNRLGGLAGDDRLFGRNGNDALLGGRGDDRLEGGKHDDRLMGGSGDDRLWGGLGVDQFFGGGGADRFELHSAAESGTGVGQRDAIRDFSRLQGDKISLVHLDARKGVPGDQAFRFIGDDGFSDTRGELRWTKVGDGVVVRGDIDGDGQADFATVVVGVPKLHLDDFIL